MPTFKRCDSTVDEMAARLMRKFDTHKPLIEAKVKIDFVFAFADIDDKTGSPKNDALTKNGVKCLGVARKLPLKDRALGRGDAEISLDGDWWDSATEDEQAALLDHELHHLAVKQNRAGLIETDDLNRPVLWLRPHDFEVGWFDIIAIRHRSSSQECIQAARVMEAKGQFYWPALVESVKPSNRMQSLEVASR